MAQSSSNACPALPHADAYWSITPQFTPTYSRSAACAASAILTASTGAPVIAHIAAIVDTSIAADDDSPLPNGTVQSCSMSQPASGSPARLPMSRLPA